MAHKRGAHHIGVARAALYPGLRHKTYPLRRPCFHATVMIEPTLIRDE